MASHEPHAEEPNSPRKHEPPPDATPPDDEDEWFKDPEDMTLEEFLENVYYNPYGPPPGSVD